MDQDTEKTGYPLKRIDFKGKRLPANGKLYLIEEGISIDRWFAFERLEVELALGIRFEVIIKQLQKQWIHINASEFGESAVICRDLMQGVKNNLERRIPAALRMSALFINLENEDRRTITEDQIKHKVDDWQAEGYDMKDFFHFAISFIPGYMNAYNSTFPGTLKEELRRQ